MNVVTEELGGTLRRQDVPDQALDRSWGFAETGGGVSGIVRHYLQVAHRRRWVILSAVVAMLLLGLVLTFLATPRYTATTVIEISRESGQVTAFEGVQRETSVYDQEFYETQYGLLRSRGLAERIATDMRLVDDPAFFAAAGVTSESPAFALSGGRYSATGRRDRLRVAADILLAGVSIDPARLSRLVEIKFTSPDPEFAAKIANTWAETFIRTNLERKVEATSYGREQLKQQLVEYKQRLDDSQEQLVAYAANQGIINLPAQAGSGETSSQERSIVTDDLAALNSALTQATARRIAAEARASQGGATAASLANPAINSLRQSRAEVSAEYQQLLVRFEPGYPAAQALKSQLDQLDQAIAREEARVSGSITSEFRAAQAEEKALLARVNSLKSAYLDLQRRSIQYNIFQQEVDTNRALYEGLLQRFKEIGVAGGVGVNNVSVVDPANVPQSPSSPNLMLNILLSLIAGLGIGAAIALLLEHLDESIGDPIDVQTRLGLPSLGTAPLTENEAHEVLLDRKSDLVDAYLAVQTNLAFATPHGVPRAFAVTSTRPAEGKSTTSLALATTLARSGKRTILIDGDMRSPSIHQLAGVGHQRGLSNFLAGEDDIASLVFPMPAYELTAMSAGPLPPNAAELLNSNRLTLLIERLLKDYDHVVVDSPPVMGLADAPLIGNHVEGVVFAIESNQIRIGLIKTALARLATARVPVLGSVLTKFNPRKSAYGSSYGYEYGYGYGRSEGETA